METGKEEGQFLMVLIAGVIIITIPIGGSVMNGWVKFHRKALDHWLYKENRPHTKREAWEDMVLLCNHADEKVMIGNRLIECKRGQSIKSLKTWAETFNWTISKLRRFFILLEKDSMIELENVQKTTRITICNYDHYQGYRNEDETKMKRKRNDDETQTATNKNDKNDKKGMCTPKSFYESELKVSKNDPKYQKVISWLFGENLYDRELKHVLAMKEQLSYNGFLKMIEIQNDYNVKTKEILEEMDAWLSKNPKSKNSTVLGTFRTFAKRAKK